jgi:hypothetical protein
VNKKVVILVAGALALAALALGALLFLTNALFPSPSTPGDSGTTAAKAADAGRGEPLRPAEAAEVQAALEKVAGAEGARVALSGGVDQPWPQERALQEFQSCRKRLEGGQGLVDADAPDAVERVCLCVAKKMQKAYPGDAPGRKTARDARAYSRVELTAIEECSGK